MNEKELMEKVAEVAPRKYNYLVQSSEELQESPFKEETVSELDMIMKQAAGMPAWLNGLGRGAKAVGGSLSGPAAGVAAAAIGGIAYALAGDMYDATKRGLLKGRHYKNMLAENPDLKELPASNVQKAFSVLHRFNPDFASDPTVAGTWVRRQSQFSEDQLGDFDTVGKLVASRKNLTDLKKLPQVPQIPGRKPHPTELSGKDRKSLDDLHAALGDVDQRFDDLNWNLYQNRGNP